jgi:hypothetical protein
MAMFDMYSQEEFQKCVVYVKQTWTLSKSTQSFSRFDAVNTKYDAQTVVNIRSIWPPSVTQSIISGWFYHKQLKVEVNNESESESEPMEIC